MDTGPMAAPAVRRQLRLQIGKVLAGGVFDAADGVRVHHHLVAKFEQVGVAHFAARAQIRLAAAVPAPRRSAGS